MNENAPALILAGGLGTRLRSVDQGLPKPMVPVCGEPFMFWLIKGLEKKGFSRFIFSTGYKGEFIETFDWSLRFPKSNFEFVKETSQLGTGGAVKNIFKLNPTLRGAWVVNGDTLLENGAQSQIINSSDDVVYVALDPKNVFDASPNLVVEGSRVLEVKDGGGSLFDGGQVFIRRNAIENYEGQAPYSFHQLIEKSLRHHKVGFTLVSGTCYDIGTPERLLRFEEYLRKNIISTER